MTDPWWISIIKAFLLINLLLLTFAYMTLVERKALQGPQGRRAAVDLDGGSDSRHATRR